MVDSRVAHQELLAKPLPRLSNVDKDVRHICSTHGEVTSSQVLVRLRVKLIRTKLVIERITHYLNYR